MNLVYGVGINDRTTCGPSSYKVAEDKWAMFPEYQMWKGIMSRCFSENEKVRRPSCLESKCCDEWKYRENFQDWYYSQIAHTDTEGKPLQIDKDIIFLNNQVYSPDICKLVPHYVNLSVRQLSKGPHGVPWVSLTPWGPRVKNGYKKPWQYSILCDDVTYKKQGFSTALDAHLEAQIHKVNHLYGIIERYSKETFYDSHVEEGLMNRILILQAANDKKRICRIY